ncbi:MAG: hypothetical protein R6U32_05170 [Candidatus Woesearchaeota archaeon]
MDEHPVQGVGRPVRIPIAYLLILTILVCVTAPDSNAESRDITGNFFTGETFELNDRIGMININSYSEVIIDYDGDIIVVRNGSCEREINHDYCVDSIVYDTAQEKKRASIDINYLGPEIELNRKVNDSKPLIDEGVMVTAEIENTGNTSADNVTYIDIYPPEIEVMDVKEGYADIKPMNRWSNENSSWQNMTMVFWQGEVKSDEKKEIEYTIKPVDYVDSDFTARIIYDDGYEVIEKKSPSFSMSTESFFEISKKFAPLDYTVSAGYSSVVTGENEGDIEVGEEALFILEMINEDPKNRSINISYIDFYIDDNLEYKRPASFRVYTNTSNPNESYTPGVHRLRKIDDNLYRWSGFIGPEDFIIALKVEGVREGTGRISTDARITHFAEKEEHYYEKLYEESYSGYQDIRVNFNSPEIKTNMEGDQTFESGQKVYFTAYMQNPNEYVNITDMRVRIDTPWDEKEFDVSNLRKTEYINFFDGFITMPETDGVTEERIRIDVEYETEYGDNYSESLDETIRVVPHTPISIKHSVSPSSGSLPEGFIVENGESSVTLTLTNIGERRLEHINITEEVSPEIKESPNMTRDIDMEKGTTRDILKYRINPPDVKETGEYMIKTYVDYNAGNETYHIMKTTKIKVEPKDLSISVKKTPEGQTFTRGVPFSVDYMLENDAGEALENITIIFPLDEDFEMIGNRRYTIKEMGAGETMTVSGEETLMPKINGTSLEMRETEVVFHDKYGNEFRSNSTTQKINIIYKPLQSPALDIERNISRETVNRSESFNVRTTVRNIGKEEVEAEVHDLGRDWSIRLAPGREKTFNFGYSEERTGHVNLQPAIAEYEYEGKTYYSSSNANGLIVMGKSEEEEEDKKKEEGIEEQKKDDIENMTGEEEEKKEDSPYMKYIYLAIFIIIICIIIFSVISIRPKRKQFEFLKE